MAQLHAGHLGTGHSAGNAQAQAAGTGAQVVDDRSLAVLQQLDGGLADDLAVGTGAKHAAADLEGKVQKVPLPQQVLQGFAARAALGQHLQAGGFLGGGAVVQPVVTACHKCIQLRRVKAGIGHPGHHQPGTKFLISSVHQRASS